MNKCKILVSDLELLASIGIYDEEKKQKQRVIINIEAETTFPEEAIANDDIKGTVSYEDIVNKIKELLSQNHIELVETMAKKIADICLKYETVFNVRVRVEKPDIIADVKSVGAELFIKKDNV